MNHQQHTAVGLFSGIGGLELGLESAGLQPEMMCELYEPARKVLAAHFDAGPFAADIRDIEELPRVAVLAAGFPCQDLSQAGLMSGIRGDKSGVVEHVFRLLERTETRPEWVLIENVSFMLRLAGGTAMSYLTRNLETLGYRWAYRVVDSRAFGLPQRRRRVILLATRSANPRLLHVDDERACPEPEWSGQVTGFYWTEGNTGLGWAPGAIPPLKGGSAVGIPSPPAIWTPNEGIGTPDVRDAERLQGFPIDWTLPAAPGEGRQGCRWRLVGNAVSVPVAEWCANAIANGASSSRDAGPGTRLSESHPWPDAAYGHDGERFKVDCSAWPERRPTPSIEEFLIYPLKPLSLKATQGFLGRLQRSSLRRPHEFDRDLQRHVERMQDLMA